MAKAKKAAPKNKAVVKKKTTPKKAAPKKKTLKLGGRGSSTGTGGG